MFRTLIKLFVLFFVTLSAVKSESSEQDVIRIFQKRDANSNQIHLRYNVFGNNEAVILDKMDEQYLFNENTPVFLVDYKNGRTVYTKAQNNITKAALEFYYSSDGRSFLVVNKDKDTKKLKITGVVRNDVIRPVSSHVQNRFSRAAGSPDEDPQHEVWVNEGYVATDLHSVHRRDSSESDNFASISETINQLHRAKRDADNATTQTLYPRILLATDLRVDTKFSPTDDSALYDFLVYLMSFWFSVDLKFRIFNQPEIRLNIAGIFISMDRRVFPYLQSSKNSRGYIDTHEVLLNCALHWMLPTAARIEALRGIKFDIIHTLTTSQFETRGTSGITLGIASPPHHCDAKLSGFPELFVFSYDSGKDFDGVKVATHEFGHILGADHDGEDTAVSCLNRDGSVMEATGSLDNPSVKGLKWTQCSINRISETILDSSRTCGMFTEQPVGRQAALPLPGAIASLDVQCKSRGYTEACAMTDPCRVRCHCTGWAVFKACSFICRTRGYAWDGTPCGENKYCISGDCVPVSE